jgi:hypothetical protein
VEQIAENMKIGAIGGAEYQKHENTSFHVFCTLLH